ncbi:MAG: ABC transporter ATP-binding protein [Acidimicrobiales bacterium]
MSAQAVLDARLTVGYDRLPVARDVSIQVGRNKVLAILGPNGAGKTTLLLTLAGFLAPLSGTISVNGRAVKPGSPRRANAAGIVLVPDHRALFTQLTVVENLAVARIRSGPTVEDMLDLFPSLRTRAKVTAGALSGGEQQMLTVARALMQRPRVLLIDEMSVGLAPIIVEMLVPMVRQVADQADAGVVLVEQHVHVALEVADQALVLVHGDVVRAGTAASVRDDALALEAAYLGG